MALPGGSLDLSRREARALLQAVELTREFYDMEHIRDSLRQDRGVDALASAHSRLEDALAPLKGRWRTHGKAA